MESLTRTSGTRWLIGFAAALGTAGIYLVLPQFAPSNLSGSYGVFVLGVCLGLAVGVGVRVPPSLLPVVAIAAGIGVLWQLVNAALPGWPAVAVALVVAVEIVVLVILLRRRGIASLRRPVDVLLLGLFALAAGFVSAVAVVGTLRAWGGLGAESAAHDVRAWLLGDLFGIVCLTPALLTARRPSTWAWSRWPEFLGAVVVTAVMTYLLFWAVTTPTPGILGWPYLVMLGPLWIAVRMGVAAVAPVIAVMMWLLVLGTVNGNGAFVAAAPQAHDRLGAAQLFAIVIAGILLLLAVLRDERLRSLTRIVESSRLLREVIDGMDAYVFAKSYADPEHPDGRFVLANRKWLTTNKIEASELGSVRPRELYPPAAVDIFTANDRRVLDTNVELEVQEPGVGSADEARAFHCSKFPLRDSDGRPWGVGGVVTDITDRVAAERALADHAELLRAVLDNSRDGIARLNPQMRVEFINQRAVDLSGIPAEDWMGKTFDEMGYPGGTAVNWTAHIRRVFETARPDGFEYLVDTAEGRRWYEATLSPELSPDGTVAHVISAHRDITSRRQAEDELRHLATHDRLTALANRTAIHDAISRSLRAGMQTAKPTAVLMVDLDRFKFVNDSLGHGLGDELLRAAAERMVATAGPRDLVGRMGGDEFCVVMSDLAEPAEALTAAWHLVTGFRAPFLVAGEEFFATVSVGVSVASGDAVAEDVLREADTALFAAKADGRDRVSVFNEELRSLAMTRLRLEGELRHALERDELDVWYQPEIDLNTGYVIAVEALLRWHHPSGETLAAGRFVDLAEETSLILEIGPWVLRQACEQARYWAVHRPDRPLTVRVNASALQLADDGLLGHLDEALALSGLDSAGLCVEITETSLLRETLTARENLAGIRERGIGIAVDDFGTGYASLAYLRQYPVNVLKIDRSFVADIATDDYDRRLVAGIVSLSDALGMTVTAEGVETCEQAEMLRSMGCPGAQGYLYSPAVPAEEITALLDTNFSRA